jgi:probable HAF family extracellular repeat protein
MTRTLLVHTKNSCLQLEWLYILLFAAFSISFFFPGELHAEKEYEIIGLLPKTIQTNETEHSYRINDKGEAIARSFYFDQSGAYFDLRLNFLSAPVGAINEITNITQDGRLVGSFQFETTDSTMFTLPLTSPSYVNYSSSEDPALFNRPFFALDNSNAIGECFFNTSAPFFASTPCGIVSGQFKILNLSTDNVLSLTIPKKPIEFIPQVHQAARAMNKSGTITGEAVANYDGKNIFPDDSRNQLRAFRWNESTGMIDLGTLGGKNSSAYDINDFGTIVGFAETSSRDEHGNYLKKAFLKKEPGSMTGIEIPDTNSSIARNINNEGAIVGEVTDQDKNQKAFITSEDDTGSIRFLEDLLHPAFKNIKLRSASGINNFGQITGDAANTDFKGYIARPLPEKLRPFPFTGGRSEKGTADFLIWRPETRTWFGIRPEVKDQTSSEAHSNEPQIETVKTLVRQWGLPGDIPLFGTDFDGDGIDDLTVWRPSNGTWYTCLSSLDYDCTRGEEFQFGLHGDIPVTGDFDNDGISDLAVYRRSLPKAGIIGQWYIRRSSDKKIITQQWGLEEDFPLQGDFNGDGHSDFAVYRPSLGMWFILFSNQENFITRQFLARQFGLPSDHPVPRDIDADGVTDLVVYRPLSGTWLTCSSSKEFLCLKEDLTPHNPSFQFGLENDIPILRNVIGASTIPYAVWRPVDTFNKQEGSWYTNIPEATPKLSRKHWGLKNDIPAGIGIKDLLTKVSQ